MPTPELYAEGIKEPFTGLAPELASNKVSILYVTDRLLEHDDEGQPHYGHQRSMSLAVGEVWVEIGEDVSWEQLEADSRSSVRSNPLRLSLGEFTELVRFPDGPYALIRDNGGNPVTDPQALRVRDEAIAGLRAEIKRRLGLTSRNDLFLFVHGYNNQFEEAVLTQAELWHFLGREGVPMVYTWPAGHGGLGGYAYDRESGEFTAFHFKELMRALAQIPEIERIHVLAHSRGTDVALTGLRELIIEARAAGLDPRRHFRIRNLILAAPDIDMLVLTQRVIAERLDEGIGQVTIYTSIGDKAISLAERLFGSKRRLGRAVWAKVPEDHRELMVEGLQAIRRVHFVEHKAQGGSFGHGYFHENPTASSDLILLMRYLAEPGTEERPLKPHAPYFWVLQDGYLTSEEALPGTVE